MDILCRQILSRSSCHAHKILPSGTTCFATGCSTSVFQRYRYIEEGDQEGLELYTMVCHQFLFHDKEETQCAVSASSVCPESLELSYVTSNYASTIFKIERLYWKIHKCVLVYQRRPIIIYRILSAVAVTVGGTFLALQSLKPSHHDKHHAEGKGLGEDKASKEGRKPKEERKQEKEEAHKKELAKIKADLPKPEVDGNSEENHAKAAEANERKVRKGVFSGEEFDNHITSHSSDPAKDFEKIEKGSKAAK